MTFFRKTPVRERVSDRWTNNRGPAPDKGKRKGLRRVSKKGEFWLFVSQVLQKFFLKIELPRICEQCGGTSNCGYLDPAHSKRRQDIPIFDWWYAFRVAVLGRECHRRVDTMKGGRVAAEPIIEQIIQDRFDQLGLTELMVKELLIECAGEVQREQLPRYGEKAKWQEYEVEFT